MKRSPLPLFCLLLFSLLAACSPQIQAPTAFPSPTTLLARTVIPVGTFEPSAGETSPAGTPIATGNPAAAAPAASPPAAFEGSQTPALTATGGTPVPTLQPTEAHDCTNNLVYLMDLTLQDGTVVSAGQTLDKRWRVENTGTCAWVASYRLRLVEGEPLGAPEEQALYPALSGTQATLRILLNAPTEPGVYRSAWQAADPQGELFGDPVYIEIVVEPAAGE